jgi:hypothetical protein
MKRKLIILLLVAPLAWAAEFVDCRTWNDLSETEALFYLSGVSDGMMTSAIELPRAAELKGNESAMPCV